MKRFALDLLARAGLVRAFLTEAVLVGVLLAGVLLMGDSHRALASPEDVLSEDFGADLLGPSPDEEVAPADEALREQLDEEIGALGQVKDAQLTQVIGHMQEARALLTRLHTAARASAAQEQALVCLDVMIVELAEKKSQCSGGQCKQPSSAKPGNKSGSSNKPGDAATAPSTSRAEGFSVAAGKARDLVRDLWGHLPERQRPQILQPLSAEFLPKYAIEIEAYYRQLAEPE